MDSVLVSHKSDDWATPSDIYANFVSKGYFDPCPLRADFDGLFLSWKEKNFVNPPYSRLKDWVIKSIEEHKKGKEVLLLIPSRTDTRAFRLLYEYGCHFIFISGRLRFNGAGYAPFPSMLVDLNGFASCMSLYTPLEVAHYGK